MCPLCNVSVSETDLIELVHSEATDDAAITATYSLAIKNPERALGVFLEAATFTRAQTALYGALRALAQDVILCVSCHH